MKKMLFIMSMVLISTMAVASHKTLVIEGRLLAVKAVKYEVFIETSETSWEKLGEGMSLQFFTINLEVGNHYMIKFIDDEGSAKYLTVYADKKGKFILDVDFSREGSAKLIYNKKYLIEPLGNQEVQNLAMKS